MKATQLFGAGLVVLGLVLAYYGYTASESLGERVSHTFTGSYSDRTLALLAGGAALTTVGVLMGMFRRG